MRLLRVESTLTWLFLLVPALAASGCGENDEVEPDPEDLNVDADSYAVTSEGRLLFFERSSGAIRRSTAITGLASGESILGLDFRPADRAAYALANSGVLYTVNLDSGEGTLKSRLMADSADTSDPFEELAGEVYGVNFNPVADRLRVVSNSGQNLRINVDTGATTTDGALNPGTPSVTAAAYSNSFAAACRTRLYVIDTSTNELFLQDPPNAGTLAKLGDLDAEASAGDWAGFEVVTAENGTAQALALFPTAGGTTIYDIDLTTAALSNPRTLALHAGETLRGMSASPPLASPTQPPGELLGVTINDKIVSFNRGAPGKLCTTMPITGLETGEEVFGIDVRPADGAVYAVGSAGKIYTVDVASGAATLKSTLSADPADTSDPFSTLPDQALGIGFNPVPDRLRVVSRGGQNYRINVDTGVTVTDASMSPTSMAMAGVAYSNAFAGATETTLYAIDAASGSLARIGGAPASGGACPDDAGNPNCGNVTTIGSLGVADLSDINGLDIDGDPAATVSAFLALTIGDATSSSLYVVDLATGAATPPTGVANPTIGGGEALRELTLAANPTVTP